MAKTLNIETGITNTTLRKKSQEVTIDSSIKKLVAKMMKTVKKDENACGLAAPQVGQNVRVVICLLGKKLTPLINPKILSFSQETNTQEEGCLSIPGEYGKVERYSRIKIEYKDEKNNTKTRELSDFDARVVQHEIDHLDGILFTDRMSEMHLQEMKSQKIQNI